MARIYPDPGSKRDEVARQQIAALEERVEKLEQFIVGLSGSVEEPGQVGE
ncbi:MAG TPA: hypothetical protein VLI04_02005 [Nocardioidaceae bacterium]|nr:hypothetical protein [Nocardioidaceae bacterium]